MRNRAGIRVERSNDNALTPLETVLALHVGDVPDLPESPYIRVPVGEQCFPLLRLRYRHRPVRVTRDEQPIWDTKRQCLHLVRIRTGSVTVGECHLPDPENATRRELVIRRLFPVPHKLR